MREPSDADYVKTLQKMTPAEKIRRVVELYEAEIHRRMEDLRILHPGWTNEQLSFEARRSLRFAGT